MKGPLKYLALWQKKRNELPVDGDPQAGWEQMRSVLDQQMPVVNKPSGFKGFKMLPSLFIAFSAAAMVYVASNVYTLEKHKHQHKTKTHNNNITTTGKIVDSLNSTGIYADSLIAAHKANTIKNPTDSISPGTPRENVFSRQQAAQTFADEKKAKTKGIANTGGQTATGKNPSKGSSANAVANNSNAQLFIKNNAPQHNGQRQNSSTVATANNYQPNGRPIGHASGHRGLNGSGLRSIVSKKGSPVKNGIQFNPSFNQNITGISPLQNENNNATDRQLQSAEAFKNRKSQSVLLSPFLPLIISPPVSQNLIPPGQLPLIDFGRQKLPANVAVKGKSNKGNTSKSPGAKQSSLDWGILLGVNSAGSFTSKSMNANFYGSSPVDAYFGLFASFKLNDNWAVNPQFRLFSPQIISTTYSHANQSKVDSGQSLTITASRKIYSINIPIYVTYNATDNIGLKAGPVVNFPLKQINTGSTLLPAGIKEDSSYYSNIKSILDNTQYQQKLNFGISAAASIKFNRFILEAAYLKSLSGYTITSGLGNYKSYNGTFQFTIGFQLDKLKLKKSK